MASVSSMTENTTSSGRGGLNAMLMPLINGFMAARVVHVAAELGIADLLAAGAKSTETLASETGANMLALHQLLRALASLGVIDELEPGRFALNAGEQLRTGVPGSVRNRALSFGSERAWRSWGELRHSILTGTPAFRPARPGRTDTSNGSWVRSAANPWIMPWSWARRIFAESLAPTATTTIAPALISLSRRTPLSNVLSRRSVSRPERKRERNSSEPKPFP
jgi:hypothetical protein